MRNTFIAISGVIIFLIVGITACNNTDKTVKEEIIKKGMDSLQLVEKGQYLVSIIGCDDCHSPKKMGPRGPELIPELRLSGYPADRPIMQPDSNVIKQGWSLFGADLTMAAGPWGLSFASNITSDETGIGNWTEANFFTAMREGKAKGLKDNRPLLPPMPWINFKNMTDEDLRAMFYYLKSTKPVKNVVPFPRPIATIK